MRSNSRVLRGWRDFGVKATAIILTILLATQMVGTPAFASGALTNKQASEDIATTVDDTGVEPSGTEATGTTVPDEAAGAANEPAPADSTQATKEPVVETVESATEPATETPAADPAANTVLGTEPEPEPAPAAEQDQLASIKLDLADGTSITYDGKEIGDDTKPVDVPANQELQFTAKAAEGWQVDKVKTAIDGVETELAADANGEYKVAADKVTDALTVKVEASAVEAAVEEPAANEAPAPAENASASPKMAMLLNTNLQLPVTIRYYDAQNQVTDEEETTVTSGVLEAMAPEKDGYYFLDATISTDNVPIAYAEMHDDGNVYYALEENALTGILLEGNETIYLNYKELGNSVRVHYTTSGEDRVDGNEVIGFPETATKGEAFSFQVALARGYEAVVSAGNQTIDPSAEASGVNTYSVTVNEESTVSVEFVKTRTVSFDPGVFNDSSYRYLYDNGKARFQFLNNSNRVQTQNIGDDGADFTFRFRTTGGSGWQCNSLQINGIYLNVPHTRTQGASATTTLYSDAYGKCVATLRVTTVQNREATYELSITGAKEDLEITGANLRGGGWSEVIPTADEGINFESSPYGNNFEEGGLNEPFATDTGNATGNTPAFRFSLQNGYKNLGVHVYGYNSDSEEVFNQVVDLPSAGRSENISVPYWQDGNWPWQSGSWKKTDVATIINNGDGTYIIKYTNNSVYGDALQLQFVEITCEKATYGVKYELGAGTGQISDSNTYDVVDNTTAVVTNRMPEAPEGQIFLGWKIKGNESGPSYAVGDALDFTNDDIFRYVGNGDGERDGYLTLVAMYTDEIAYGSSRPVNVKYFFENEDGEFVEDEEMRTTVQGVAGKQLSMLQYENTLEHDGYEYTFDDDASKTTITVTGDNAIELRYTLERAEYTYNAGEGGSVDPESERVIAQKEGAAKGSVATADPGYKFDGWYVNDGGKDVKIAEDNANGYNVKLSDDGTKLIPQRHNGKYEGGTFTAKFAIDKTSFVQYDLGANNATWEDAPDYLTANKRAVVDKDGGPLSFVSGDEAQGYYLDETNGYRYGDEVTVANTEPKREGYTFMGWSNDDAGSNIQAGSTIENYPYNGDGVGNDCLTLHAQWKANSASIVFVENGGTDVEDMTGTTDQAIEDTQMPTTVKAGYDFAGWYSTADFQEGTEVAALPEVFPVGTTTYYAKWIKDATDVSEAVYYVQYFKDGEKAGDPETVETTVWNGDKSAAFVVEGSINTTDKFPGYDFQKTEPAEIGATVAAGSTVNVYYVADIDTKYTVRHWFQNVDDDDYSQNLATYPDQTLTGTTDQETSAQPYDVEGFTAQAVTQQTIAGDGSTVVDVYYDRSVYTVTYQIIGDYFVNDDYSHADYRYGAALELIGDDMDQQGYVWTGWSGLPATMPASDVTVTSSYSAADSTAYTVRHWFQNVEGEDYSQDPAYPDQAMTGVTGELTNAQEHVVEGFTALPFDQATIAPDGETVVDIYYDRNVYNIAYLVVGDYFATPEGEAYASTANVRYGTSLQLIADDMQRDGFVWTGWSGLPATMPANDVTVVGSYLADTSSMAISGYSSAYDGLAHGVTVSGLLDSDEVAYFDVDGVEIDNRYVDVTSGAVPVTAVVTRDGYEIWSGTATVQITPAELTVTTPSGGKVFDGAALELDGVISGFVNGETAQFDTTGSQTAVGSSMNWYEIVWNGTAKQTNYNVSENLGVLTVWPQSINPDDPDPDNSDPGDPDPSDPDPGYDPDDPDPEDPDQPFYTGATVDRPAGVPYNGADQTWIPTVTDAEGKVLTEGTDYTVSYSTEDRTNVTGTITVTITGMGDYAGTVTRTYQITPVRVAVNTQSASKVYDGTPLTAPGEIVTLVNGETATVNTSSITEVGSIANDYEIVWNGTAKQSNYTVVSGTIGTLTITAAPVPPTPDTPTPDTPTPTPLPTPDPTPTPGTTTPVPTPGPGDGDATPADPTDEAEATIDDEATPLTAPEPIDDDATPLAANEHRDCWVHWLMLLGILVTVVYYGGVGVRRVRFSSSLQSFEDDVLGNDETNR